MAAALSSALAASSGDAARSGLVAALRLPAQAVDFLLQAADHILLQLDELVRRQALVLVFVPFLNNRVPVLSDSVSLLLDSDENGLVRRLERDEGGEAARWRRRRAAPRSGLGRGLDSSDCVDVDCFDECAADGHPRLRDLPVRVIEAAELRRLRSEVSQPLHSRLLVRSTVAELLAIGRGRGCCGVARVDVGGPAGAAFAAQCSSR
jgi:hypothetical protein